MDIKDLPRLAKQLQVDAVHVSEVDTVGPADKERSKSSIYNSWCLPTFLDEFLLPAKFQIGSKDAKFFSENKIFQNFLTISHFSVDCTLYHVQNAKDCEMSHKD